MSLVTSIRINTTVNLWIAKLARGLATGLLALWAGLSMVVLTAAGYVFYLHSQQINNLSLLAVLVLLLVVLTVQIFRDSRSSGLSTPASLAVAVAVLPIWPLFALWQTFSRLARASQNSQKNRQTDRTNLTNSPPRRPATGAGLVSLIVGAVLLLAIVLPAWISGYGVVAATALDQANLVREPVGIAGTGSMYPTFPKSKARDELAQAEEIVSTPLMRRFPSGFELAGRTFFNTPIGRGDIISFSNDQTKQLTTKKLGQEQGFVKRVVAIAGDVIEIRDGLLHLNGQPQLEPYTARARSTFGGQQVAECQQLQVPDDKLFVLGDNRKVSNDSRGEIGLVDVDDVDHFIPWQSQPGQLDTHWRDTSQDLAESSIIQLDVDRYIAALNNRRRAAGLAPLKAPPQLATAARLRGQVIIDTDDVSFEATTSGYTIRDAITDAGYHNIVLGESIVQGYFEHDELIENQLELPDTQAFLFNDDFDDIGLATVQGELNGCPTQVIVQHFAGFQPPNYSTAEIESWRQLLDNLRQVQPSWQRLTEIPQLYDQHRDDIDKINELIAARARIAQTILAKLEANQWLTPAEQDLIEQSEELGRQQHTLAEKLNNL